ncbi:MAG: hypothetical protein KatS3mg027_0728 [Bacteroidia bacterium]|nr:MAG: hypothetical protein KatS3mg027_0728 [Bacteroidia bacterium]
MKYVCIEGIIGSGKTTLAEQLYHYYCPKYKVSLLKERFEENKLLELFYQEPDNYNFLVEYSFLIDRFHQIHEHIQTSNDEIIIADYCFKKCLWFAENNLPKNHFQLFKKHFLSLEKALSIQPDLLIFLDVKPDNALQNIRQRSRPMEEKISLSYLQNLYNTYQKHIIQLNFPFHSFTLKTYNTLLDEVIDTIDKTIFL